MRILLAAACVAALALAACNNPTPKGRETGAAMPDTSQPRDPNEAMTAPDAGATGTVPANGATPPVQPTPAAPAPK
jgi:hypothetical protein